MISKVFAWDNTMVMAYDEAGKQMPEFQGEYDQVRDKILAASDEKTAFYWGRWRGPIYQTNRSEWSHLEVVKTLVLRI